MLQESIIPDLLNVSKQLQVQNMEQGKKMDNLENHVSDLEQYSQINDVIKGLVIQPRSCTQAVKGRNSEDSSEQEETPEGQVAVFLQSKHIPLNIEHTKAK